MKAVIVNQTKLDVFLALLRNEYPDDCWQAEHRFHEERGWLFDYATPVHRIAIEKEGGIYGRGNPCPICKQQSRGAHSSVSGILRDLEKYNAATVAGWKVLRFTPEQLKDVGTVFGAVDACRTV